MRGQARALWVAWGVALTAAPGAVASDAQIRVGAPECAGWKQKSCAEVEAYRLERIRDVREVPPQGQACITSASAAGSSPGTPLLGEQAGLPGEMREIVNALPDQSSGYSRQKFLGCLRGTVDKVNSLQKQDTELLVNELRNLGVTSLSRTGLGIFLDPNRGAFAKSYSAARLGAYRATHPDQKEYSAYAGGAYRGLIDAVTADTKSGKVVDPKLEIFTDGRRQLSGGETFEQLVLIAQRGSDPMNGGYPLKPAVLGDGNGPVHEINPTTAKLILFEMLRQKLLTPPPGKTTPDPQNVRKLQEIIWKINLKFDRTQPFCRLPAGTGALAGGEQVCAMPGSDGGQNGAVQVVSSPYQIDPMAVTIHNGYFLGGEGLHDPTLDQPMSINRGIDCSYLVHKCLRESGVQLTDASMPRIELSSRVMTSLNMNPPLSTLQAGEGQSLKRAREYLTGTDLECEAQLKPGDILAVDGHVVVFAGYQLDKLGKPQFTTFEAAGGETRGVNQYVRQIYTDNSCDFPYLTAKGRAPGQIKIIRVKGEP